jgi:hypothetical protein
MSNQATQFKTLLDIRGTLLREDTDSEDPSDLIAITDSAIERTVEYSMCMNVVKQYKEGLCTFADMVETIVTLRNT